MKTQQAWLFLTLLIFLLAATLPVVSMYKNFTSITASLPAPEKGETPYGMVRRDAILAYSPSTQMRLQQVSMDVQSAQAGRQVGHFKFQNVNGGFMTSEDLKGKVTVVDIWATWCHWCVEEVPIYNQLYDAFEGNDVALIGIAIESARGDIQSKVRQLGMKYPVLIGDDEGLKAFGPVQGLPTTLVINKEGKIYKQYRGTVSQKEERIKQDIRHLLAEDSR